MSLGFILGTASKDHETKLIEQMAADMKKYPDDQFYYLVPNHIKFETEIKVLSDLARYNNQDVNGYAQSQLQVFSFSRLAWYLLKNTAEYQVPRISTTGLNMLVLSILKERQGQLKLFAGEINHPGFIAQITTQLEQLRQSNIDAASLQNLANQLGDQGDLAAKLHDLNIIYPIYESKLKGRYVGNTDIYQQLVNCLSGKYQLESQEMLPEHAHFYLDRFSSLTASEQSIADALVDNAQSVWVSLVLDRAYPHQLPDQNDLFFESGRLYNRLYQRATQAGIPVIVDQTAKESRTSQEMGQLDRFMIADTKMATREPEVLAETKNLQIFETDNRMTELNQVARQIRQLVATGDYRYRDFLILTRHLDLYDAGLEPTFSRYDIPIFNDHERYMDDHPLVELLSALFEVKEHYYRYADVMRLLKTNLLIPTEDGECLSISDYQDALAITENWLLKTGLHGDDWLQEKDWQFYRFNQTDIGIETDQVAEATRQINQIRHFIKQVLPPLFTALDEAPNGRTAATILYQFLINNHVLDNLSRWQAQQQQDDDLEAADQQHQVWQTFCSLLDEYVEILGDEPFNADDFRDVLQAGFASATYSQIPSTMDQVVISETGIVQNDNRKVVFLIGATDAVMPDMPNSEGLLSDQDYEQLDQHLTDGQFLPASNVEQLASDPFLNYLGFMSAQERLILSAPHLDNAGNELELSPYVTAIQRQFSLQITEYHQLPKLADESVLPYVGAPLATIGYLTQIGRQSKDAKEPLPHKWRFIYQQLHANELTQNLLQQVWQSLDYQNIPKPLTAEIVNGLYGDTINTSVSKLEEFYQNEYAYFLEFGLKLKEREMFELSPANTGEFFHAALDQLIKTINATGKDIASLTETQLSEMIDRVVEGVATAPQFMILASSERMKYIGRQLAETVRSMGKMLFQQSQRSTMRPMQTEVLFGQVQDQTGLKPLQFELPNDKKVRVRGKIDRIDQLTTANQQYLGVVDYKSGDKKFNVADAYYGIAMQMLTYLNAVKLNWQQLRGTSDGQLAGALYLHINNPKIKLSDYQKAGEDIVKARLKDNEYQGILLNDDDLLKQIDTEIKAADKPADSLVFPFKQTKTKFSTTGGGNLFTEKELNELMERNLERIQTAAKAIFNGSNKLNPAKWTQQKTALQYSPYKDIFQFDAMLPENNYHQIKSLSQKDVFALLEGAEDDEQN